MTRKASIEIIVNVDPDIQEQDLRQLLNDTIQAVLGSNLSKSVDRNFSRIRLTETTLKEQTFQASSR